MYKQVNLLSKKEDEEVEIESHESSDEKIVMMMGLDNHKFIFLNFL